MGMAVALLFTLSTAGAAEAASVTSVMRWLPEYSCPSSGDCIVTELLNVPAGYDHADVFLQNYYLNAIDPSPVTRIKIEVTNGRYDSKNGELTLIATAALDNPYHHCKSPTTFEFGVGIVVLLYNDTDAVLTDPAPIDLLAWGDTSKVLGNAATIDIDPAKVLGKPVFTGFMTRGFEIQASDPLADISEQIIDVSKFSTNGVQADLQWLCGLTSKMSAKLSCRLNLVGVTIDGSMVASATPQQHGPAMSGGCHNVGTTSNWYAASLRAWALVKSSPGHLKLMSGGGTTQMTNDAWCWDARVDGDKVNTDTREVIMQEVHLF